MRPIDFKGCRKCNAIVIGWVCGMCGLPLGKENAESPWTPRIVVSEHPDRKDDA